MRIVVTGATGFIGRHLIDALIQRGHDVVAVARHPPLRPLPADVRFMAVDMADPDTLPAALGRSDLLIHLAWGGLPNYRDLTHIEHNLPSSYRFIKEMVRCGLPRVLVAGTCFEYGMKNGPLSEDDKPEPDNCYGVAKDTLRRWLVELARVHPFDLQWARLFYTFGFGQNSNSLLAQLDSAIERGDAVFNMSGGEQLRDYLPVEEVALRLAMLSERPGCTGIFNCCSGRPTSVRRLVEDHIKRRAAAIDLNLGHFPYNDHEPMAFWGDPTKFERCVINSMPAEPRCP